MPSFKTDELFFKCEIERINRKMTSEEKIYKPTLREYARKTKSVGSHEVG
jgi:hypothetical protein